MATIVSRRPPSANADTPNPKALPVLMAVDIGLRAGLAVFDGAGKLRHYRSTHFASRAVMRRAVPALLDAFPEVDTLLLEGGGPAATAWEREARRRQLHLITTAAHVWRDLLLHPRERRDGKTAKQAALQLARDIIAWSGAARPTSLRDDAAEAICAGFWAALQLGRIADAPPKTGPIRTMLRTP